MSCGVTAKIIPAEVIAKTPNLCTMLLMNIPKPVRGGASTLPPISKSSMLSSGEVSEVALFH